MFLSPYRNIAQRRRTPARLPTTAVHSAHQRQQTNVPSANARSTSLDASAKPTERGEIDVQGPCAIESNVELVNCSQARAQSSNNETEQTDRPELQQIDPTAADSEDHSRTSASFQYLRRLEMEIFMELIA